MITNLRLCRICFLILSAISQLANAWAEETLHVVFALPLTGQQAYWGKAQRQAAQLGYETLAESMRSKLSLHFEDTQLGVPAALSAYRQYQARGQLNVMVTFGSAASGAIAPLAEKDRLPLIAITSSPLAAETRKFVLRFWLSSDVQTSLLLQTLAERHYKRVAMVVSTLDSMLENVASFKRLSPPSNIQLVFLQDFPKEEMDFRTVISRLKTHEPQAIVMALVSGQYGEFMKQLRVAGVSVPVYGYTTCESSADLLAYPKELEGVIYAGAAMTQNFTEDYEKRYGEFPELAAATFYDLVRLLGEAADKGFSQPEKLNEFLHSIRNYPGAAGNFSILPDNSADLQGELRTVRAGRFEKLR